MAERLNGGVRRGQASGLRKLLLDTHRKRVGRGSRWHRPGAPVSDYEQALVDGLALVVSDEAIFTALDPEPDKHCKGGRTCMRCDPGNTGVQTVDVAPQSA